MVESPGAWGSQRIKLLFANTSPPDPDKDHEIQRFAGADHYGRGPWLWILVEQLINSVIVGAIAGLSAKATGGTWESAAIGFGLTFLLELRKYRQLVSPGAGGAGVPPQ